jgi:O-antigen ligase
VSRFAGALALFATAGGTWLVLLVFGATLQAPFLVPKFAALGMAAALGWVAFALQRAAEGRPRWSPAVATGALLVLATTGLAWACAARGPLGTPYAAAAFGRWVSLFGIACGASVVAGDARGRRQLLHTVAIGAAVVAAVGLLQHVGWMPFGIPVISTPGSTFGNRNPAAEVMAMALPFGIALLEEERGSASAGESTKLVTLALVLQLVYLAATRARGAWLGAAVGVGVALAVARPRAPRTAAAAVTGAVLLAVVAAAVPGRAGRYDAGDRKRYSGVVDVLQEGVDPQATALRTRIGLWRRSLAMVARHPLVGVGPGNFPVAFPLYAEPGAREDGVLTATLEPRQAHEDVLERAAECGVVGGLALVALAAAVIGALRRRIRAGGEVRTDAAGTAGALAALTVTSLASFPLEMPGTIALTGLALGLVAPELPGQAVAAHAAEERAAGPPPSGARRALFLALAFVGLAVFVARARLAVRAWRGSRWLQTAEIAMRRDTGLAGAHEALGAIANALEATPDDYRAHLRASQLLLREHRAQESAAEARSALQIEPFAPNALVALAAAELDGGDHAAARRDAERALSVLHDYPFALRVHAAAAQEESDALAVSQDKDRLRVLAALPADDDTGRAARTVLPLIP